MIQPVELRRFSGAGGFYKRGARKERGGRRVVRQAVEQLPGCARDAGYGAGPSSNAAGRPVDVARGRKLQAHGGRVSDHVARTGQVPGYERVHVCRRTNYTISLFTTLRDRVHFPLGRPPVPLSPSSKRPLLPAGDRHGGLHRGVRQARGAAAQRSDRAPSVHAHLCRHAGSLLPHFI